MNICDRWHALGEAFSELRPDGRQVTLEVSNMRW
jgi:hypothetical protein